MFTCGIQIRERRPLYTSGRMLRTRIDYRQARVPYRGAYKYLGVDVTQKGTAVRMALEVRSHKHTDYREGRVKQGARIKYLGVDGIPFSL